MCDMRERWEGGEDEEGWCFFKHLQTSKPSGQVHTASTVTELSMVKLPEFYPIPYPGGRFSMV